jgi:hypothetical protein
MPGERRKYSLSGHSIFSDKNIVSTANKLFGRGVCNRNKKGGSRAAFFFAALMRDQAM